MAQRRSDVLEMIAEKALLFTLGGIVTITLAVFLFVFRGDGMLLGLAWVLILAGVASVGLAGYSVWQVRDVKDVKVECPYCHAKNRLTEQPTEDFSCIKCARMIPVLDGAVLPVFQVRCGFCNTLNYYNEKSEALICENCDREIPISTDAEHTRNLPRSFTIHDDDNLYELVLVDPGNKTEEMIDVLQHMLALNRAQVKQIMQDAPVTLLTGITRKKAEMLQAQLAVHSAAAEFKAIEQQSA